MKWCLPLALLTTASAPVDHPRTYLVSIIALPLKAGESLESFSIATWGVQFKAVCKIPSGWRIKAGNSASPDGMLEGEGSQGATWFNRKNPPELRKFVLITLYDAVQRVDIHDGSDATFKGQATISTDDGERMAPLTYRNVQLISSQSCI
jgi:hypothetical protein